MKIFSLKKFVQFSFVFLYSGAALVAADDTEIYFGNNSSSVTSVNPNILFILDTSSSMTNTDGVGVTRLERMKEALRDLISDANNVNMGLMRFSKPGGAVIYPVKNIDEEIEGTAAGEVFVRLASGDDDAEMASNGTMDLSSLSLDMTEVDLGGATAETLVVSVDSDDAEERISNGSLDLTSSDLEFMADGNKEQLIGIRFASSGGLTKSSTVVSAVIELYDDGDGDTNSTDLEVNVKAELGGDTGTFSNSSKVSDRTLTTSGVDWTVGNFSADKITSADISSLINEVVADAGWSDGDALTFVFERTDSSGSGRRVVRSRNNTVSESAKLQIAYTSGLSGTDSQTLGLRFQEVGVPKGVTITSAVIEFSAAQTGSDTTNLTIAGQASGNAPVFTATGNDLSLATRPRTTASVNWVPGSWDTVGGVEQSADITSVIQEIVNRADWCGNNALALMVSGSGKRIAASYDLDPSSAPYLKITYDPDSVPATGGCFNREYSYRVANSSDDGEEKSGEDVYLDSSDLELTEDGAVQKIGIRFGNVQLEQGAEIQSAYLEFTADGATSDSTSLTIYGQDADNAVSFGATSNKVSTRTKTSNSVSWNSISSWVSDVTYRSPDVTAIVQEIVDRGGWAAGNGMAFVVEGSGKRRAYSYDGNAGQAPRLVVFAKSDSAESTVKTVRDELLEIVDDIQYKSGTPIVGSYYEGARYFLGESVDFGAQRGGSGTSRRQHGRVSHSDSWKSDEGTLNRDTGCTDDNLSASACETENITGSPDYITPVTDSCQANHIVILTDGSASYNDAEAKVKALTGVTSCAQSGNQACGPELATWLATEDISDITGTQTITTHSIGFNFTGDWIKSISTNGGGGFYEADSAAELADAFEAIVTEALKADSTFSAPAVAINQFNRLNNRDEIYFAVFRPTEEAFWPGNVKKYKLSGSANDIVDKNSNLAVDTSTGFFSTGSQSFWSAVVDGNTVDLGGAAENLPAYDAPRKIYTYTGTDTDLTVASNAVHEVVASTYNSAITKAMLGDGSMSDAERESLIDWIRGKDVLDEDGDPLTTSRQSMSDPLHSRPVVYTHAGTESNPESLLLFGTNDGRFRAVDVDTGVQQWAFIPQELLPISKELYDNTSVSHPYGVDGAPVLWVNDPDFDGTTISLSGADNFAYAYFGLRRGGRNYYALDVTDDAAPELLWQIKGGVTSGFTELGQSWSKPIKTKISLKVSGSTVEEKDVLIFAGGYDSDQDNVSVRTVDDVGRAIFIVDAVNGSLIWSGGPTNSFTERFTDMKYSIPASPAVADLNNDGLADQIYVGDVGGQVWRFDIDNTGQQASSLVSGGVIADLSADSDAANTRRFYHTPDLTLQKDASGNDQIIVLIGSGYHAHPTDLTATDRFYMLKVSSPYEAPGSYTKVTESDLYDATDNDIGQGVDKAAAQAALDAASGWYVTLPNAGEKVLSAPLTAKGSVIFTTYEPKANTSGCVVQPGTSREYVVKVSDATPVVDRDDDGDLDVSDRSGTLATGSIVSEPVIVFTDDGGGTTFLGTEKGSVNIGTDRVIRTFWYQE